MAMLDEWQERSVAGAIGSRRREVGKERWTRADLQAIESFLPFELG